MGCLPAGNCSTTSRGDARRSERLGGCARKAGPELESEDRQVEVADGKAWELKEATSVGRRKPIRMGGCKELFGAYIQTLELGFSGSLTLAAID